MQEFGAVDQLIATDVLQNDRRFKTPAVSHCQMHECLEMLCSAAFPDILNTTLPILATLAPDEAASTDIAEHPQLMQILIALISKKKVAIRQCSNSLAHMPMIVPEFCALASSKNRKILRSRRP
jgi:hypothetical protein